MPIPKEEEMGFFKKAIEYYFEKRVLPLIVSKTASFCEGTKLEETSTDSQISPSLRNLEVRAIKAGTEADPEKVRVIISYDDSSLHSDAKTKLYSTMFISHDFTPPCRIENVGQVALKEFKFDIPLPREFLRSKGIGDWTMMAMFEEFQHTKDVDKTAPREFGGIR